MGSDRAEKTPRLVWVVSIDFADREEAFRAFEAIHTLLGEMDQIGTLTMRAEPDEREDG